LVILFTCSALGDRIAAWAGVFRSWCRCSCQIRSGSGCASTIAGVPEDEGRGQEFQSPLTEAFANWSNAKIVLIALLGGVMGQGVVWYTGCSTRYFSCNRSSRSTYTANLLIAWSLLLGTGFFIVFGALSDKVGRKPIILAGRLIAALTFFPIFKTSPPTPTRRWRSDRIREGRCARRSRGLRRSVQPGRHPRLSAPCDTACAFLAQQSVKYSTSYGPAGSGVKVSSTARKCLRQRGVNRVAAEAAGCRGRRRADRECRIRSISSVCRSPR
jgi:hypothetical protein